MWKYRMLFLAVTFNALVGVYSSCDLIGLPKCECNHPQNKRYEIECQNVGLSALPGKVNYTLADGEATGNFSHNSIKTIPAYYFLYMKHFDVLDFSSNSLTELGKNSLAGLETRLASLNLSKNRIGSFSPMAVREYIRLNNLDLSGNYIKSPCRIHTADILTYSLASNGISSLGDQCFADSTKVQTLDLSGNKISSISKEAFQGMRSLQTLNLAHNVLADLKEGLYSLIGLDSFQTLSLRGNRMEYLSSVCPYALRNIRLIDFGYNNLVDIQKYCFTAYSGGVDSSTLTLNFEHNRIRALAGTAFAGLETRLVTLLLNHNRIVDVDVNTFKSLGKLSKLSLANNAITSLEFLRQWEENTLLEFSVANNLIRKLSPKVFEKMLRLTKLSLNGNLLLNIESNAFQGMSVLSDLSIRDNLITNLEDGAFDGLGQLKKLAISGNALVTLKNCTFANLDRLVQFHFQDNLIHCDCDLLWLLEFVQTVNKKGVPDLTITEPVLQGLCHTPQRYAGKYIANEVSINCPKVKTNACFGLHVSFYEPLEEAMNVTFRWDEEKANSAVKSIVLSQVDVETDEMMYNQTFRDELPITLPEVLDEKVYKICVAMTLTNGKKEHDCTVYPEMIKKPTTTMAPTTEAMTPSTELSSGDVAAICLGVILILILILLILFAVYLCKTQKYRVLMPSRPVRYAHAGQDDSERSSTDRSPSSDGKPDPLDFRPSNRGKPDLDFTSASEDDPMMIQSRPSYEEHDL